MNLESMPRPETIHVSAPAALSRPLLSGQTMPQRSPFAIQELLGLSESSRSTNGTTTTTTPTSSSSSAAHASSSTSITNGTHANESNSVNALGTTNGGAVSAVTPTLYAGVGQTPFNGADHHQMTMAASRMAYFNAHAAVAAAFLPHNMAGAGSHLGFHTQASGECFPAFFAYFYFSISHWHWQWHWVERKQFDDTHVNIAYRNVATCFFVICIRANHVTTT